jgi:hypothetical protein
LRRHRAWLTFSLFLAAHVVSAQCSTPISTPVPLVTVATLPDPDATLGDALHSLASRAGVVFVGQVISIERKRGAVEVHFAVQQVVQGEVGATYTLREWAGLWPQGEQRYVLGQRAMIFLHPVSVAGLSSPVDGMEGIVPLVPTGADVPPVLDTRRLATRVKRAVGQPLSTESVTLADAIGAIKGNAAPGELPPHQLPIISRPHLDSGQVSLR